jgi:TRAP-type C4-dicarboxylate transport system permease small subunit
MNKTLKALTLVFLGCIIWSGLAYIAIAFLKAESNPFIWSQSARGGMLFVIFCYVAFSPLMVMALKDEK